MATVAAASARLFSVWLLVTAWEETLRVASAQNGMEAGGENRVSEEWIWRQKLKLVQLRLEMGLEQDYFRGLRLNEHRWATLMARGMGYGTTHNVYYVKWHMSLWRAA